MPHPPCLFGLPFSLPFRRLLPRCRAVALALIPALAGAAWPALAKEEPEPVAMDSAFKATEQSTQVFSTAEAAALKGVTRVAVPLFSVEFITADNVKAQTSGFASIGRASASGYYKLLGVGEPEFQAITETLYANFLRDLKAAGIDVVPPEQVQASPTYRKLAASGAPAPIKESNTIVLAPPGMAIYGFNKTTASTTSGALFGAIASMGSGFGAVGAAMDTVTLQKELNAAVLEVQLRVHFVQLTNHTKGFFGRMSNTASVSSNVYPHITTAVLNVQSASTRGAITLVNPLAMDAGAFVEVRDKATSTAEKAGAVAVMLFALAVGSKDSNSSEEKEAVADPVKYRQVVAAGLDNVSQMFIHRLRSGE